MDIDNTKQYSCVDVSFVGNESEKNKVIFINELIKVYKDKIPTYKFIFEKEDEHYILKSVNKK